MKTIKGYSYNTGWDFWEELKQYSEFLNLKKIKNKKWLLQCESLQFQPLGRLRQDCEFEASLGDLVTICLKIKFIKE